ncbi:MAG TPA: hypothetical protein VII95_14100 [Terriglobales bacterium]
MTDKSLCHVFGKVALLNQPPNRFSSEGCIGLQTVVQLLVRNRLFVDQAPFGTQSLNQQ